MLRKMKTSINILSIPTIFLLISVFLIVTKCQRGHCDIEFCSECQSKNKCKTC